MKEDVNMKFALFVIILGSISASVAADFQDKPGNAVISTRRSFKVAAEDCKKSWEVSAEADSSYCAVNIRSPEATNPKLAVLEADQIKFSCSVKDGDSTKIFALEIIPHGVFGYLVQAEGQVLFSNIEQCLVNEVKKLPRQEVSVTFAVMK